MPTFDGVPFLIQEDGELVFVVVPDGFEAFDHAGEHVRHGFVGFGRVRSRRSGRCGAT